MMATVSRRSARRAQLLALGRAARVAIESGRRPGDLVLAFPLSRATFYRALALAYAVDGDPNPNPNPNPNPASFDPLLS